MRKMALLACIICLQAASVRAFEIEEYRELRYDLRLSEDRPLHPSFWERLEMNFRGRLTRNAYDGLQPLNTAFWRLQHIGEVEYINDRYARSVERSVSRSLQRSLQEAAVDTPLVSGLLFWLEDTEEHVGRFFRGSVNNVDEADMDPLDVNVRTTEEAWHKKVSDSGGMSYGFKPGIDQRLYWSGKLGPKKNPFLRADLRYKFKRFDEHQFESVLTIPIDATLSVRVGMEYLLDDDDPLRATLRVYKSFKYGYWFAALTGRQQSNVIFGFARTW